ncbi:MAG: family 20 glycosylhydrolase [Prolixibacteraceae bacterium]|jgi:hexosaminidase|nr:family 20 glycosylhydrolase [Prolixibacteraceae bacterium]
MNKLILLLLFCSVATVYGQDPAIQLIPQPVEVKVSNGSFLLTKTSTIGYDVQESKKIAEMFSHKLIVPTGFSIMPQQGKAGSIQFNLNKVTISQVGKEGYTLVSSPKGVTINANTPAGLFYGMQTLLQLLPKEIESKTAVNMNWTVPSVKITDYPRFSWRGMMLDVSRTFFTKDEVKRYIDQISRYKYNIFHWHLTDDNGWRIEIKSLPKLTEIGAWRVPRFGTDDLLAKPRPGEAATVGGFYTQSDIKEIIQFAQDRYVTVVPEIDIPGHSMAAIASYPEISCTKDTSIKVNPGCHYSDFNPDGTFKWLIDNSFNPSDEKTYEFLDQVFTEVAALFPSPYIHVGGDECYAGFWAKDPGCQALMKKMNLTHPEELQAYFAKRVEAILKAKGKKLTGWDEILPGHLDPETIVMNWHGDKVGIEAAKMGHPVVLTPTSSGFFNLNQGEKTIEPWIYDNLRLKKVYSFNPVLEGIEEKQVLGGEGLLWTEQVETLYQAEYMIWPRGWAMAEDLWSPDASKNWTSFIRRVENEFNRVDIEGVNYSSAIYDAIIKVSVKDGKMTLRMETEAPDLDIIYTIDESMPGKYSPKYSKPIVLTEGPITVRVVTFRGGKQIGHLITLSPEELKKRSSSN